VLSCSDSRSPGELVFDQGLGDLFMIRIAGNVVAPSGIGSVEYAVTRLGVRLVVVMGHTHCGAVQATFDTFGAMRPGDAEHIKSITGRIAPHIAELAKLDLKPEDKMMRGVRANVLASLDALRHGSQLLEQLDVEGRVQFKACVLHLENGETEWVA
jgi:carbonic anhydrase